jgi:hypothetical protein
MLQASNSGQNDYSYQLVFGNVETGKEFFNKYSEVTQSLFQKFPEIRNLSCCTHHSNDVIASFFSNYTNNNSAVNQLLSSSGPNGNGDAGLPSGCNKNRTYACAFFCGLSTTGWGSVWCLWGCACVFCPDLFPEICSPEVINGLSTPNH